MGVKFGKSRVDSLFFISSSRCMLCCGVRVCTSQQPDLQRFILRMKNAKLANKLTTDKIKMGT